jgi:hypothetical protein
MIGAPAAAVPDREVGGVTTTSSSLSLLLLPPQAAKQAALATSYEIDSYYRLC